jgi:hypothetical protein
LGEVVAILVGCGRLATGLFELAAGGAAATRSPPGTGQQQAQPEQAHRPDHDAVEEQHPGGAGDVISEYSALVG